MCFWHLLIMTMVDCAFCAPVGCKNSGLGRQLWPKPSLLGPGSVDPQVLWSPVFEGGGSLTKNHSTKHPKRVSENSGEFHVCFQTARLLVVSGCHLNDSWYLLVISWYGQFLHLVLPLLSSTKCRMHVKHRGTGHFSRPNLSQNRP